MSFTTLSGGSAADATSFIGSAGVDSVNLNNVGTGVWLGAQGANDVISFESSSGSVSGYRLRGGQGQDQLSVSDGATSLSDSFINLNLDNDVMQLLAVSSSTIYGGGGNDTLQTGALSAVRFNSNKGDDTNTIAGATGSSIFGGQGNDTTTLNGDYSSSVVQGDNDNDTLSFSNGSSLSSTTVNGNAGNDTINVNAITSFAASTLFGGDGDDSISAANSAVGVLASGDAGADNLVGGSNNDSLLGGSGDDNLLGNAGADSLIGGSGDDFFLYNTGDVATGEVINGGTPAANGDTILVQTSTDFTNLTTTTILTAGNIENIRITDTTTGTFIGSQLTGQAVNVNGTGAGVSTLDVNVGTVAAVDLSTLTFTAVGAGTAFTTGTDIVDIAVTAAVASDITGTTLADNITGNTQADTLRGDVGDDTITGGNGVDDLHGDLGNDSFYYTDNTQLRDDLRVIGGDGIDSIVFTTAIDTLTGGSPQGNNFHADFANVRSTEEITLFGASRVNLGDRLPVAGITTINTGADNTTLRYDNIVLGTITVNADQLADNKLLTLTQFGGPGAGNWFNVTNLRGDVNAQNLQGAIRVTTADGTGFDIAAVGGNAQDTLSGGNGNDTITGAASRDTIDVGGGSNHVRYISVADGGAIGGGGVFAAGDSITSFAVAGAAAAVDKIDATTITNIQNVVGGAATFESVGSGAATGTNTFIFINNATAASLTDTANVLTAIGNFSGNAAGFSTGDVHIFIVGNSAATAFGIYAYTEADGNATATEGDFRLLGTADSAVTGFDADNVV